MGKVQRSELPSFAPAAHHPLSQGGRGVQNRVHHADDQASAAGVRTYTATSSQGLLFMAEALFNASGLGLPIVMTVANRAIGAPINIWNDHSDAMAMRDVLSAAGPGKLAEAEAALIEALGGYVRDGSVMMPGASWFVRARNPG